MFPTNISKKWSRVQSNMENSIICLGLGFFLLLLFFDFCFAVFKFGFIDFLQLILVNIVMRVVNVVLFYFFVFFL